MVKTIPYSFDNKAGIEHEINQRPSCSDESIKTAKMENLPLECFSCSLQNDSLFEI